jgi:hypothetical protein
MNLIQHLSRIRRDKFREIRVAFYRNTDPAQMREWSRTNLYAAVGLLLLAMILLAVASPGPLSVELPEHMASTNAAFIELVLVAAGGFFVSGFMFFLAAWKVVRRSLPFKGHRRIVIDPSNTGLPAGTVRGRSELESLLTKVRRKSEI